MGIYLGACGWQHPEWTDALYPAGLPADWQLAFYQTQFSCVWLSAQTLLEAGEETVAGWIDEVNPEFRFLVQGRIRSLPCRAPFDAACMLDADEAGIIWIDQDSDLAVMADRVRCRQGSDALYLVSRDARLDKLRDVETLLDLLGA